MTERMLRSTNLVQNCILFQSFPIEAIMQDFYFLIYMDSIGIPLWAV